MFMKIVKYCVFYFHENKKKIFSWDDGKIMYIFNPNKNTPSTPCKKR
jgi:hypothetical protein